MKWLLLAAVVFSLATLATRDLWRARPENAPVPRPFEIMASPLAPLEPRSESCAPDNAFDAAARDNATSYSGLAWAPFRVPEQGWDAYAALIGREIGSTCPPASSAFASALAAWQKDNRLNPDGRVDANTVEKMRVAWTIKRPFVVVTRDGYCPPGAEPSVLADAQTSEGYRGKQVQVRADALAAYRRMREAAQRELPAAAADGNLLTIISGYRSPEHDAERCQVEQNCGTAARANCSAHRTGFAFDLYVGNAPGFDPTSSTDINRSFQAGTPVYQWLVLNADRFGFMNYAYEPWHWEWTGAPIAAAP